MGEDVTGKDAKSKAAIFKREVYWLGKREVLTNRGKRKNGPKGFAKEGLAEIHGGFYFNEWPFGVLARGHCEGRGYYPVYNVDNNGGGLSFKKGSLLKWENLLHISELGYTITTICIFFFFSPGGVKQ